MAAKLHGVAAGDHFMLGRMRRALKGIRQTPPGCPWGPKVVLGLYDRA